MLRQPSFLSFHYVGPSHPHFFALWKKQQHLFDLWGRDFCDAGHTHGVIQVYHCTSKSYAKNHTVTNYRGPRPGHSPEGLALLARVLFLGNRVVT